MFCKNYDAVTVIEHFFTNDFLVFYLIYLLTERKTRLKRLAEFESTKNMTIALVPSATLAAVIHSLQVAHLFKNQTIDVSLKELETLKFFILLRCFSLMTPVYHHLVYLFFDSDFRSAFYSRFRVRNEAVYL